MSPVKTPLISIIIPSFNTAKILKQCLKSLSQGARGLKGTAETIVVDNGSTDNTPEFLKTQTSLKFILNSQNLGFAKAVNQGLKKAQGRYCLLLNSDIICRPGSITRLVEFAGQKKKLGLVGGKLLFPNQQPQPSVFNFPTLKNAFTEFFLGRSGYSKYLPPRKEPVIVDAVVGAVMLIPRQTLKKAGYFSESYFMYFEDLDYCRRLKKLGLPVYYHPRAEFIHLHGASGQKTPAAVNDYLRQSSRLYFGPLKHSLINFTLYAGQKWQKLLP